MQYSYVLLFGVAVDGSASFAHFPVFFNLYMFICEFEGNYPNSRSYDVTPINPQSHSGNKHVSAISTILWF